MPVTSRSSTRPRPPAGDGGAAARGRPGTGRAGQEVSQERPGLPRRQRSGHPCRRQRSTAPAASSRRDDALAWARALWREPVHERRTAAIEVLRWYARRLLPADLALVEAWVREARGWAYVDPLAGDIAGPIACAAIRGSMPCSWLSVLLRYRARDITGERVDVGPAMRLRTTASTQRQVGGQQPRGVPAQDLDGPLRGSWTGSRHSARAQPRAVPVRARGGAATSRSRPTMAGDAARRKSRSLWRYPWPPGPLAIGLGSSAVTTWPAAGRRRRPAWSPAYGTGGDFHQRRTFRREDVSADAKGFFPCHGSTGDAGWRADRAVRSRHVLG